MNRDEALSRLRALKPRFADMNIRRLALFGSTARDEAGPDSDVDILIEFAARPVGLFEFARRQRELGEYLGGAVDLVSFDALVKPRHKHILDEAVDV